MKLKTLVVVAAAMAAPSLYAQAPPQSPEMAAAREAVNKACANEPACTGKTGREMLTCLRSNADKVSQPCKDALAKMPARPAGPPPQ